MIDLSRYVRLGALTTAAALFTPALQAQALAQFDLPPQSLAAALRAVGSQTSTNVLFDPPLVEGLDAPALKAQLTVDQAFERLLAGSGLTYRFLDERTVMVVAATEAEPSANATQPNRLRLAQRDTSEEGADAQRAIEDALPSRTQPDLTQFELAEVIVTGTRLRNTAATSPVISFDRQTLEEGGYTTVQDLMSRVPQNFGSKTPAAGTSGGNVGLTTQIDLRGLGSQSTLTLVNGRRVAGAAGNQGSGFDISMIPIAAISRLDILTDGASALYGSDAVGGVVNLVLRRDLDGAESTVQYGTGSSDRESLLVSQLFGQSWSSGYFLAAAQYDRRDAVSFQSAGITSTDFTSRGGGDYRVPGFGSPGTVYPAGFFAGQPFMTITGPGGAPVFFAALPPGDGTSVELDQLGLNQMTIFDRLAEEVAPSQENRSLYVTGEQEIGAVKLFVDAVYAKREGEQRLAPNVNYVMVPPTNAHSPFAEPVLVGYVFDELGPIVAGPESEGWLVNFGARGSIGGSGWTWEVTGSRSHDEFTTAITSINAMELNARLASSDPGFAFNPFGDGSSQAPGVVDALMADAAYVGSSDLRGVSAQLEGALMTAPGGSVRLAFGGEYRDEELDTRTRATGQPENILFPHAKRHVAAGFAEVYVPLVGDANAAPGARELALSLAARFDRYGDFGDTTNPKVGVLWRPVEDLSLKANWGTSFRAPALRELYIRATTFANFAIVDPNAPGGPTTVFVPYITGGNPNLEPEEADTYTITAEYRSTQWPGARFAVGYFHTDYENRIRGAAEGTTPEFLLSIEDQLPEGIILRAPDGTLQALNLININSAETVMSGWDFDIGYGWSTERLGRFELSASATLLDQYEDRLLPGTPVLDRKGKVENPPDWRGRLTLGWKRSIWSASMSVNYVDRLYNAGVDPRILLRDVGSQTTLDAQFALTFGKRESSLLDGSSVRVGFMNLFDEKPPFVDSSGGFDVRNHMFEGRQFYVRLSKAFGTP